ncbi:hypothetical protein HanPI659440_Chr14g0560221 [Helianthus annuus]|nr:hypothetical protein HanPI659440_Chr14g0560221 [Helianthus annuus]
MSVGKRSKQSFCLSCFQICNVCWCFSLCKRSKQSVNGYQSIVAASHALIPNFYKNRISTMVQFVSVQTKTSLSILQ